MASKRISKILRAATRKFRAQEFERFIEAQNMLSVLAFYVKKTGTPEATVRFNRLTQKYECYASNDKYQTSKS